MIQSNTPLPADARRIRTIIWSGPLLVVTSYVLYNRLVLGKERRTVEVEVQKNPHARLGDNAFMRKYPEDNPINTNSSS
ncbi:hypothetical protein RhiXN_11102 [Rhizoctonia solani]|uniref:Uncharacterized protein n=1 Tax=Rhizoctonia solani TaxID=456999 RepID=A0A8H8P7L8_9AGAM|nr:uncharacterized protein RhiXN_11102 [Rhizoctonia solani]QRW26025.1 hypothetical protein RhiXN_11102 [Rhizoctonia solani]